MSIRRAQNRPSPTKTPSIQDRSQEERGPLDGILLRELEEQAYSGRGTGGPSRSDYYAGQRRKRWGGQPR